MSFIRCEKLIANRIGKDATAAVVASPLPIAVVAAIVSNSRQVRVWLAVRTAGTLVERRGGMHFGRAAKRGISFACSPGACRRRMIFWEELFMKRSKFAGALVALSLVAGHAAGVAAKEWTTIRIGYDATYPPFESVDPQGKIVGFEVEYAEALCAKMHVTCTAQNQDWDGIIPALLGGKFDAIMSSMNETPARAKRVLFSDVYYATAPVWVAAADNKSDDISPEALKGKTIGTQSSTTFANYIEKHYKGFDIKLYPGGNEPLADLANGRLDYVVLDELVTKNFIEKNPNCCRIISKIERDPEVFGPGVGVAVRPDDTGLIEMFNKAIQEANADGTFDRLQKKYFQIDISPKK